MEVPGTTAARWYLAALIDGEGSAYFKRRRHGSSRNVSIHNSEDDILNAARECMRALGIEWTEHLRHEGRRNRGEAFGNKTMTVLVVSNRAGLEVLAALPLQSARKLAAIREAVATYRPKPRYAEAAVLRDEGLTIAEVAERLGIAKSTAQLWLARTGRVGRRGSKSPPREEIVALYVDEGLSITDTADRLGVPRGSMSYWMDRYGIERRRAGRTQGRRWSKAERQTRLKGGSTMFYWPKPGTTETFEDEDGAVEMPALPKVYTHEIVDDCATLRDVARRLREVADEADRAAAEGWDLEEPICGGYGFLARAEVASVG